MKDQLIVGIAGIKEKRHVLFSLIRYLSSLGRTAIVTQDRRFKLLSKNQESLFVLEDLEILVCEGPYELLDEDEDGVSEDNVFMNANNYDYIIIDIIDEIPFNLDKLVVIDSHEYYLSLAIAQKMENVKIVSNVKNPLLQSFEDFQIFQIPIAWNYGEILVEMIDRGNLIATTNKKLENAMINFLANILEVSPATLGNNLKMAEVEI